MNPGFRALAAVLDYPSEALLDHLDEVRAALAGLNAPVATLAPMLDRMATADLYDLQENYSDTFDRGRRTSLNLFEHVHGDSRDRGQAMVDLLAMYRAAGLELQTDQLPDYLPVFLEYLSLLDADAAREQLAEIAHILQSIRAAAARRESPYAAAFDFLLAFGGEAAGRADEAASEDDTTFEAINAAWREPEVNFLDAPAPCNSAPPRAEQPIHIHRRAA